VAPSGERGERDERGEHDEHDEHDAAELHEQLVAMADPVRAEGERAYLKHCYEHLGVPMGPGRKLVKEWLRGSRPELDHVLAVAAVLWDSEIYEDRRAAVDLLVEVADQLGPEHLDRLTAMVRDARTWALVDPLGHTVVGKILTRHPEVAAAHGERWSLDDDSFWVRRLSVLSLSRPVRAGSVPFATFATVADRLLDEREFFIRKSIGWVLRDIGRDRPDEVEAFCRPRMQRISTVTWREAEKRLSPDVVAELDALR
jgi:3-methyladenine DNA glycosylase AlkD